MEEQTVDQTVVFADIAGSTRIYEEKGNEEGRRLILGCLDLVAEILGQHGGRVIERRGDELLATFPEPDMAAQASADLHQKVTFASFRGELGCPMRVRIGFAHGPVIETAQGLFGNTLHSAARIAGMAKAGQTLTCKDTLARLGDEFQLQGRFYDTVVLKGQAGECEVHELVWSLQATRIPVKKKAARPAPRPSHVVELEYRDEVFRVDRSRPRLELGRDAACDVCVEGTAVSRLHARVVWNRGELKVEDVSANGTIMEGEGRPALTLHHFGATLSGSGVLRLGADEDDGAAVRFRCKVEESPPGETSSESYLSA